MRKDGQGRTYYVNHNTRVTSWFPPGSQQPQMVYPQTGYGTNYYGRAVQTIITIQGSSRRAPVLVTSPDRIISPKKEKKKKAKQSTKYVLQDDVEDAANISRQFNTIAPVQSNSIVPVQVIPGNSKIPPQIVLNQPPIMGAVQASSNIRQPNFSPLPPGWEMKIDPSGKPYYVDHNTKSTSYNPPPSYVPKERLPLGWDIKWDSNGRPYYVDHNTKSTTYQPPV